VPRAEIQSALSDASALFRAQIDVPVLLMQADHDGLFVPQNDTALFSGWPDVSFVLLGKAGHKGVFASTSKTAAVEGIACWINQRFPHASQVVATRGRKLPRPSGLKPLAGRLSWRRPGCYRGWSAGSTPVAA
jgi:hypothetical protein